jgi:hypothetical protein
MWGASVRSAARSFAERARGLASTSASSGVSGRRVNARKLGGTAVGCGRCRDKEGALLRVVRKLLTMRSSSE